MKCIFAKKMVIVVIGHGFLENTNYCCTGYTDTDISCSVIPMISSELSLTNHNRDGFRLCRLIYLDRELIYEPGWSVIGLRSNIKISKIQQAQAVKVKLKQRGESFVLARCLMFMWGPREMNGKVGRATWFTSITLKVCLPKKITWWYCRCSVAVIMNGEC